MADTLSPNALKLIDKYFNLPFDVAEIRCPYFNNAKVGGRAQLRVLAGKGTPQEIVDEAKIISMQYKKGIFDKDGHCCLHMHSEAEHIGCIRQFLIDNNLGVDCSGFISHVLIAHFLETKGVDLRKKMFITSPRNFFRWIISKLRPVEQMSVAVYDNPRNSVAVNAMSELKPGDLIIMLKTGPRRTRNHMLLVIENSGGMINYVHARAWSSEGQYSHGVTKGQIKIIKPEAGLLDQEWIEKGSTGGKNETLLETQQAETLQMKRLKF